MTEPVDWSLPIQTVDGQPAKLVYTRSGHGDNYLVVTGHSTNEQAQWTNEEGGSFGKYSIRNIPERVKLEGWVGIFDDMSGTAFSTREEAKKWVEDEGEAYIINLALVSEKCPEAITVVGGK